MIRRAVIITPEGKVRLFASGRTKAEAETKLQAKVRKARRRIRQRQRRQEARP